MGNDKGELAYIETSPQNQPGARINIKNPPRQDAHYNLSAVFEDVILQPHTFCGGTRRLRHGERLIIRRPAITM